MKPAICTSFDYEISFAQVIPMIRQAGFEVVSIGARPQHSDYHTVEGRARIKTLTREHGLAIDSVHAPFPEGDQLCSPDETKRMESVRQCRIAVDAAQDLNARVIVIHLDRGSTDPQVQSRILDQGIKSIRTLSTYAIEKRIRVAVENGMGPYAAVLDRIMTEFSDEPIGFCYDSGHENVDRTSFKVLEKYGARLVIVHLHDNLGKDSHMLPYEGDTDWSRFMQIFRGLDYSRSLLLEVDIANSQFKDPTRFLAEARKRAERLLQCQSQDQ